MTAPAPTVVPPASTAAMGGLTSVAVGSPIPPASLGGSTNVVRAGTPSASVGDAGGINSAIDGSLETLWNAQKGPPGWFAVTFDRPHFIERLELVVAQLPAGDTVHEVWMGDTLSLELVTRLGPTRTSDGQTLTIPLNPIRTASRVLVRTLSGPSNVAWKEIRVFGAAAQTVPSSVARVQLKPFLKGNAQQPTGVYGSPDGTARVFILEQRGRIIVTNGNGDIYGGGRGQPFLDITNRVSCCTERGLEGLAFPPGFRAKRYFYVSYTHVGGPNIPLGALVVSRFRVTDNAEIADPRSEEVILVVPQPHEAHNGGHIAFSPKDGYLYVGLGDGGPGGGAGGTSQDLSLHLGKILRIDPESHPQYAIPPGNPFVGRSGVRAEIWALGLRNPWGMRFDQATGDLFIADAGETEWEEVNVQRADSRGGENYGWPLWEGRHCHAALTCDPAGVTMPISEYHHLDGCVIVGGAVARGPRYPKLTGTFITADFCSGRMWGVREEAGRWVGSLLTESRTVISALGTDEVGNIYVADYGRSTVLVLDEL
ncbi:MAG: PQQ-dependent sugar dehydrogenase [Chloroflexi bacterium]|nr:PQQ-dependent sugar dehydrogenase [Chloroflexota bacterium]